MKIEQTKSKTSSVLNIAAALIVIACLKMASPIVLPLLLALFLSVVCAQPIIWLHNKKVPRGLAILIVLLGLLFSLFLITEIITSSLSGFSAKIPEYEQKLDALLLDLNDRIEFMEIGLSFEQIIGNIDTANIFQFSSKLLGQLGSLMSNSFLILLITIFLLDEMKTFDQKFELLKRKHDMRFDYLKEVAERIRNYLSLKTAVSLATGFFIYIWLEILGLEFAVIWGVIAFLLNYIPNIGSIIAAAPTLLLASIDLGFGGFVLTALAYLTVNIVIGNIIEPKIMGRGMGLSTLVVFLSLIVWGYVFGTVGMFLSVPITISIKIMLENNPKTQWLAMFLSSNKEVEKELGE